MLPERFWNEDGSGVIGGTEFGFLGTTSNREVAFGYASRAGAGTVFEIQTGMINEGSDLSWLTRYPY